MTRFRQARSYGTDNVCFDVDENMNKIDLKNIEMIDARVEDITNEINKLILERIMNSENK